MYFESDFANETAAPGGGCDIMSGDWSPTMQAFWYSFLYC
jgi:hypothetical protein